MTNTPMTSREAFESEVNSFCRGQKLDLTKHHDSTYGTYLFDSTECAYRAWQASQAQQASVIEMLKRDLDTTVKANETYAEMEADNTKQAQTIAELVEALEGALVDEHGWRDMAREVIAKVKGK